jgi:hypothetical protein
MSSVSHPLVAEIKKRKTILDVVRDHVLYLKPVKPQGWYIGRCPFHQSPVPGKDDPPSKRKFWIDARSDRQLCSCFVPRCAANNPGRKPMDVINFYARLHNLSNRLAILELADQLGLLEKAL